MTSKKRRLNENTEDDLNNDSFDLFLPEDDHKSMAVDEEMKNSKHIVKNKVIEDVCMIPVERKIVEQTTKGSEKNTCDSESLKMSKKIESNQKDHGVTEEIHTKPKNTIMSISEMKKQQQQTEKLPSKPPKTMSDVCQNFSKSIYKIDKYENNQSVEKKKENRKSPTIKKTSPKICKKNSNSSPSNTSSLASKNLHKYYF